MTNTEIINYLYAMPNQAVVETIVEVLNGFIDLRDVGDRIIIKNSLEGEGIHLDAGICHRDED